MHIIRCFAVILFIYYYTPVHSRSSEDPGEIICIENGQLLLGFNSKDGTLHRFDDITGDLSLIAEDNPKNSFWQIHLHTSSGVIPLDIFSASLCNIEKVNSQYMKMTWSDFREIDHPDFEVVVTVRLDEHESVAKWKIYLNGIRGIDIEKVIFPKISGIKDLQQEKLAVADWMGSLLKEPRKHMQKNNQQYLGWAYPGHLSMQLMALYNPGKTGLYLSCNDSLAYRKNFGIGLDSQGYLWWQIDNFPEYHNLSVAYSPKYEAITGIFKGDWITAAQYYRQWAVQQKWARESRLKNRQVPSWVEETALWVWNRGKVQGVLLPAEELKKRLGLPVSVLWHWWHGCPYDEGFPEYFPPRDGEPLFKNEITKADEQGIKALVYMNQIQWGNATESWEKENASRYAVKGIDGKTITHVYNIFSGQALTTMCMGTSFWRNKYASLAEKAINHYHVGGIYMDQACLGYLCYDHSHGHPVGGGNYWMEGSGTLTRQIRASSRSTAKIALSGEGVNECWLPYLDLFLTLQVSKERYAGVEGWQTIPLFQAVYHPYAVSYGSYSSLLSPPYDDLWPKDFAPSDTLQLLNEGFNKQFLMEQARSFVWGIQPMIANYKDFLANDRKEEIDYLMKLARVRSQGLKYLLHGEFVRPPEIKAPEQEMKISRLSIYAGREAKRVTELQGNYPTVYVAAWKSDDHHLGIAVASILDYPFPVKLQFDTETYGLQPNGDIFLIKKEGKDKIGTYRDGKINLTIQLSPKDACILEFISNKLK
ncbi:DUF6259 domain-containing protein [Proteiniphilum sp.]|uniref:DUF6259 domain-containing protein n=1 Tax=Proteiniphilum sp. TaxID=1926877 RepID=UPI002B1F0E9D|nr:DUF6259 domain-containing protein [Proteiniphilum sp.]MEA4916202.1 DUF6259 domain-containing protein [Proteiniphilum sp.]